MMNVTHIKNNLAVWNQFLKDATPEEIITWAMEIAENPLLTTSFGNHAAAIVHACIQKSPALKVVWCDTGYNTPQTYRFAQKMIHDFNLNIAIYTPTLTTAYRDAVMGIPTVDDPLHAEFTEQVKLEPFRRALKEQNPDVWFTNIRKGQTAHRDRLDILSISKEGILKVSPFFHWNDDELESYLNTHALPNESRYFDPTKALDNRECGIHINL